MSANEEATGPITRLVRCGERRFDGKVAVGTGAGEPCFGQSKKCGVGRQDVLELARPRADCWRESGARVVAKELEWVGMEVAHYRATPAFEIDYAGQMHHSFNLFTRPPDQYAIRFEGVTRHIPPSAGSIILVPAGIPFRASSSGHKESLNFFLEPGVVERVAAEAFELDPAKVSIPPLDGVQHPQLRATMLAIRDELAAEGGGDRLAIESLANLLAVHLLRHASAIRPPARRTERALPRTKLHAVIEFIEDHLDTELSLAQMAEVVHLSAFHFARQFKTATGLPPHQYVVTRRVERAQQLLRESDELPLAEIASGVGFSDQSQFSTHFKRVVGVTPTQFRKSARIA